jgi:hypothetical protein
VWAGTRAQPGDQYGSGTLHPGQVLRGSLALLSPLFRRSHFHHQVCNDARDPSSKRWNYGRERLFCNFAHMASLIHAIMDLLRATNLRHGTDGFTSPLKIRWLRPGLDAQTWVLKASKLPLDHQSRYPLLY